MIITNKRTKKIMAEELFNTKSVKRSTKVILKANIELLDLNETTFFFFHEYSSTTVATTASRYKDRTFTVKPLKNQGITTVKRIS